MLTASICTIGDEILIGQVLDTNSYNIAQELSKIGVKINYKSAIGDTLDEIISELEKCIKKSDVVIVTGGLGPTKDDITKVALKQLSNSNGYKYSEEQAAIIKRILTTRGIAITDINRDQALVPENCQVIENKLGTAPCMKFSFEKEKTKSLLYSLPGVPFEALGLLPDICTDIKSEFCIENVLYKTAVTFGIPESTLAKMIEEWEDGLPSTMKLAYLPNPTIGVRLRLSYYGDSIEEGENLIDEKFSILKEIIGDALYGWGETSLQKEIGKLLQDRSATLSTAESCTGGNIAHLITSVAGSSNYYRGGVVSYANEVKINSLGVDSETIDKYGAVSRECVEEMALGVLKLMDTDYSVATSGIAGPGGGSEEKPVGTCWIAVGYYDKKEAKVLSQRVNFASDRSRNIERFTSNALNFLRLTILNSTK